MPDDPSHGEKNRVCWRRSLAEADSHKQQKEQDLREMKLKCAELFPADCSTPGKFLMLVSLAMMDGLTFSAGTAGVDKGAEWHDVEICC